MKIGFIGGGAMAEAIICGINAKNLMNPQNIYVSDHKDTRCQYLEKRYKIHASVGSQPFLHDIDMLILAIKPQAASKAINEIKNINHSVIIVSIIAGMTLSSLEKHFTENPVIRVMPNTPMAVSAGMSAITPGVNAKPTEIDMVRKIFSAAGETIIIEEKLMDAVSGLSGSGPAFIFVIIDAMSDAGVSAGLKRDIAIKLAAQTVLGAAKMVLESELHPAQLRDQVTSPGGTTIEGVHVMEQKAVRGAMIDAVTAAVEKSKLMGNK
ncbi:pyrroline-5-carboxylate reductase [Pectinatus sottacetonis]|uniref:pyrroline-5-carboxylate reductase n=1 Tax=Pectinatus sottacetonis TaxID=1002795 RepID=UPI0018C59ED4|nr:pyrroline-5-carboxylate reductase [Pectinatus sottacetonis]